MTKYLIGIEGKAGDFSAFCPDVLGCASGGKSIEDVKKNMVNALAFHLGDDRIPAPSDPAKIMADPEWADLPDVMWTFVEVPVTVEEQKPMRVNMSLPSSLLHEAERWAKRHGTTRSGLAAVAMREYMAAHG